MSVDDFFTPSDVLTPSQTEAELERLRTELESETEAFTHRIEQAAVSRSRFKCEYAKAYLKAEGPVAQREAEATVAVGVYLTDREVQEARAQASLEHLRSLRDSLSAVQSQNANIRYQAGLS